MTTQGHLEDNDKVLHDARAWNWQWPDTRGRWNTRKARVRQPSQPYHGPSKHVVARRELRGHYAHRYPSGQVA